MVQLNQQDEKTYWLRFKDGDNEALHTLYNAYFQPLYNYGHRFTDDTTRVEDAIQDLFLKLIRTRENLTVPDSVKAYLLFAYRTVLLDKMQQEARKQQRIVSDRFNMEPAAWEDELVKTEEATDLHNRFQAAMQELTPRQREAIFLRYHHEMSYPDIAETLGLSQKAAYKLIARAIHTLREASALSSVFVLAAMIRNYFSIYLNFF